MFYFDKFKKIRLSQKLTQKKIAMQLGKSLKTIQRWESGATEPSQREIEYLATALSVSVSRISDIKEKNSSDSFIESILPLSFSDFLAKSDMAKYEIFLKQRNSLFINHLTINENKVRINELNLINDTAPYLMVIKDSSLRIKRVNNLFNILLLNNSRESFFGKKFSDIWRSRNQWKELEELEEKVLIEKIKVENETISFKYPDGSDRRGKVTITPIYDENNNIKELLTTIFDFTEEFIIKKKLEELVLLLNYLDYGIIINKLLPHEHNIYVNRSIENIFNLSKDIIVKDLNFLQKIIHPDDLNNLTEFMNSDASILKCRICLPNNQIKWIKYIYRTVNINSCDYFFNIFQDITEEMSNKDLCRFIAKNLDNLPHGVLIVHPITYEYLYVNEAASTITGYSTEELYANGHKFWRENLIDKDSLDVFKWAAQEFDRGSSETKYYPVKYDILRKDKTVCTICGTLKISRYNDIDYRVLTFADVTKSNIGYDTNNQ